MEWHGSLFPLRTSLSLDARTGLLQAAAHLLRRHAGVLHTAPGPHGHGQPKPAPRSRHGTSLRSLARRKGYVCCCGHSRSQAGPARPISRQLHSSRVVPGQATDAPSRRRCTVPPGTCVPSPGTRQSYAFLHLGLTDNRPAAGARAYDSYADYGNAFAGPVLLALRSCRFLSLAAFRAAVLSGPAVSRLYSKRPLPVPRRSLLLSRLRLRRCTSLSDLPAPRRPRTGGSLLFARRAHCQPYRHRLDVLCLSRPEQHRRRPHQPGPVDRPRREPLLLWQPSACCRRGCGQHLYVPALRV